MDGEYERCGWLLELHGCRGTSNRARTGGLDIGAGSVFYCWRDGGIESHISAPARVSRARRQPTIARKLISILC